MLFVSLLQGNGRAKGAIIVAKYMPTASRMRTRWPDCMHSRCFFSHSNSSFHSVRRSANRSARVCGVFFRESRRISPRFHACRISLILRLRRRLRPAAQRPTFFEMATRRRDRICLFRQCRPYQSYWGTAWAQLYIAVFMSQNETGGFEAFQRKLDTMQRLDGNLRMGSAG